MTEHDCPLTAKPIPLAPGEKCPHCGATEDLTCLDAGRGDCSGPVEYRTTPDRSDGKHFPRCEAHFEARLAESPRILELTSPARPDWYDEANVGERWEEDE